VEDEGILDFALDIIGGIANQFMGSSFFDGTSADHIGPISLGFIHDPRYLQPMLGGDNSAKRDRLQLVDIEKIISTEARTGVYPMSWYSSIIWEHIKSHYKANTNKIAGVYRDALKQNMANFMYILWFIMDSCPDNGEEFLTKAFLEPKYECFNYSYTFNDKGEITSTAPRHFTDRNQYETDRYRRIAVESVYDYNEKDNRHMSPTLTGNEISELKAICRLISSSGYSINTKERLVHLVEHIENRVVATL